MRRRNESSAWARADRLRMLAQLVAVYVVALCIGPARAQDDHARRELSGPPPELVQRAKERFPELDSAEQELILDAFEHRDWAQLAEALPDGEGETEQASEATEASASQGVAPLALPGGTVTAPAASQKIPLPKGEGSIQGMGESFTPSLSSGTGTFSVPIALPAGRAGVQPSLALSYSTAGGNGPLGIGWSLGVPLIARQTDKGLPHFVDGATWTPQEDRFIYNGGSELVPVDNAEARAIDDAPVPGELATWQQYRARVEGAFMRFFRAPDASRWVVQSKDGTRFEFGCLLDAASCDGSAVEADPENASHVFTWYLVRMSDVHGASVHYRYLADGGNQYLSDIYYDMPARCGVASNPGATRGCNASLGEYGRHVHLVYDGREDVTTSYARTWKSELALRLIRIEVTSHEGRVGQRYLVRRYHLDYDLTSYHTLLTSVTVEGRPTRYDPALGVNVAAAPVPEEALGDRIVGSLLPAMQFGYTKPAASSDGVVPGFGGFDKRVYRAASSPVRSLDEGNVDLLDVNGDGLSDVLVTAPDFNGGKPAVFFNGFAGRDVSQPGSFSDAVSVSVPSGMTNSMRLSNLSVRSMDVDGDGHGDLLYMPRQREYGYFVLSKTPSSSRGFSPLEGWSFAHVPVRLPTGQQDPRIDLGADAPFIKTLDVNRDGLIDVMSTTGTAVQVWLNLGHMPGGDGRFGSIVWSGSGATLTSAPITSCLPIAGRPLDFSDGGTRLADMNGDGLLDVVQLSSQRVVYWPGRGEGAFGDGPHGCTQQNRAARHVTMANPPVQMNVELAGVHLADMNADGADDLLQVGTNHWSVWFNRSGQGFTDRLVIQQTPFSQANLNRVRLADIDGSGTVDVVFGEAGRYQWVDPMGGVRPRLLQAVDNGLGALTTLEYGSSADDYLRDLAESQGCDPARYDCFTWHREAQASGQAPCDARVMARSGECVRRPGTSPVVSTVVRSVTTTDRLDVLGVPANVSRTEYAYHDGYYEGIEQEFRGFGAADAVVLGDRYEPTSVTRTYFHQGRRPNEIAADRLADNPNEVLKGREFLTEVSDGRGTYLSTSHATYRVRTLLTGLDGRVITYAYVGQSDELRYDTAPFTAVSTTLTLASVERETARAGRMSAPSSAGSDAAHVVAIRGARHAHLRSTIDVVDNLGHLRQETAVGRVGAGEAIVSESESARIDDAGCGGSGWLFRGTRSFVHAVGGPNLKESAQAYDACGHGLVTTAQANLPSEFPDGFQFSGASGGTSYTQTAQTLTNSVTVDAWGQTQATCVGADLRTAAMSACYRYGEVAFDEPYATFVERETVATGFSSGAVVGLTSTAVWDAGLGVLTKMIDPNLSESRIYYDGLGRLTATVIPNGESEVACSGTPIPTTRIFYELTTSPATQPVSRIHTIAELDCRGIEREMQQSYAYVDGLGRTRAALAQGDADGRVWEDGRGHSYVRSGLSLFTKKGKAWRGYQAAFYDGIPDDYLAVLVLPNVPYAETRYDAFGRATRTIAEDRVAYTRALYHALSTDAYDSVDVDDRCPATDESCTVGLATSPIAAEDGHPSWFDHTYTTVETDGHGRAISQHLRQAHYDGRLEHHYLFSYYRADGAVTRVVRALTPDGTTRPAEGTTAGLTQSTERLFYYDSAGRRIGSSDPDTNAPGQTLRVGTWRYLFNVANDLVAVRDPRGSGQDFYYDRAGRLLGEAWVYGSNTERAPHAVVARVPTGAIAMGSTAAFTNVQVRYFYDTLPDWAVAATQGIDPHAKGKATGFIDRAQQTATAYDARGQVIWTGRQIALLETASTLVKRVANGVPASQMGRFPDYTETLPARQALAFDALTYVATTKYDHAGRVTSHLLPSDDRFVDGGAAPKVGGRLAYNRGGALSAATLTIDNIAYPVVNRVTYTRDGLVSRTHYGDGVVTHGVRTDTRYDDRRRPMSTRTVRTPTGDADPQTLGAIGTLVAQDFHWDVANNLTAIDDLRPPTEWPSGHKPQSVSVRHDALYRVEGVEYTYDTPAGDAASDWRSVAEAHRAADPMRSKAAAMLPQAANGVGRVVDIDYEHDWLANMVSFHDDAELFYERSIGDIVNGKNATVTNADSEARPSALYLAENVGTGVANGHRGWLETTYHPGGNLATMTVHGRCADKSQAQRCRATKTALAERRNELAANCVCAAEQHYAYTYDEVNRIAEARRFDREATGWELKVRQRYRYDASNQRTLKQTIDVATGDSRVALYVFPGDFERRGLRVGLDRYENIPGETETQYLVAGARVVWQNRGDLRLGIDADHRITMAVSDLIQSTSAVIDLMSGEPLEVTGFYPNGAREHYVTSSDVNALNVPLEPIGFTGKEAEEEVGLTYFGERYLVQRIGRWATPDPLHIHAMGGGEALNSYHYVSGNLLQGRDPLGLVDVRVQEFDSAADTTAGKPQDAKACTGGTVCAGVVGAPGTPGFQVYTWSNGAYRFNQSATDFLGSEEGRRALSTMEVAGNTAKTAAYTAAGALGVWAALELGAVAGARWVGESASGAWSSFVRLGDAGAAWVLGRAPWFPLVAAKAGQIANEMAGGEGAGGPSLSTGGSAAQSVRARVLEELGETDEPYEIFFHGTAQQHVADFVLDSSKKLFTSLDEATAHYFGGRTAEDLGDKVGLVAIAVPKALLNRLKKAGLVTTKTVDDRPALLERLGEWAGKRPSFIETIFDPGAVEEIKKMGEVIPLE